MIASTSVAQAAAEDTVLRADPPAKLVDWLVGHGGANDLPAIALEQTDDDVFSAILTRLLEDSGRGVSDLEFNVFGNDTVLERVLKMLAGPAIMVAHDLRSRRTLDRKEAYDEMAGKLKPLWLAAERVLGPSDFGQQPFGIAMIATNYDLFPQLEFPRKEAGRWNLMRFRVASSTSTSPEIDKDEEHWNNLKDQLKKWLERRGGSHPESRPNAGDGS